MSTLNIGSKQRRALRKRVLRRDGNRCISCWATAELTIDHKIPRSRGGTNSLTNLQTLCVACNHAKADKLSVPFLLGLQ